MIIQFCGLSGSGKTTLAYTTQRLLNARGIPNEVIDGDEYRRALCPDLGYSREDRNNNIRRLAFVAGKLSAHGIVAIICAINPYDAIRKEVAEAYNDVYSVYVNCSMEVLLQRDTKGMYKKALLPDGHPEKITNLTGINDPFDVPQAPDLELHSDAESPDASAEKLANFIVQQISRAAQV